MGILDLLRNAVPLAATARSGYLQGQTQEEDKNRSLERQGVLDKLKAAVDQSTINENNARGQYYRDAGAAATAKPSKRYDRNQNEDGSVDYVNRADPNDIVHTPLTGAKKTATLKDTNVLNPSNGMIEDVYSDGSRKGVRKATKAEIAKANHVPRDGDEPPPMNSSVREAYLNSVADRAVTAAKGDARAAAGMLSQDPAGLEAYSNGLATRHLNAAAERYRRQQSIDYDVHPTMDPTTATPPPAKPKPEGVIAKLKRAVGVGGGAPATNTAPRVAAPAETTGTRATPNYPGASRSSTSGDIDRRSTSETGTPAAQMDDASTADVVVDRILKSGGKITAEQALRSPSLSDAVKARVRKRFNLPAPAGSTPNNDNQDDELD